MTRAMIIQSGLVINTTDSKNLIHPNDLLMVYSNTASIGDLWDGVNFSKPAPVPTPVPQSISPAQMRVALINTNLFDRVTSAVASGDQKMKIWWEFSTAFERNNVYVVAMATQLNVTDKELDDLFILGSTL